MLRSEVTALLFIGLLAVTLVAVAIGPARATSNSGSSSACAVKSPFDGSCGFVENPPSWAAAYPGLDQPISYFHNGTYGIVWLNSTTFNVLGSFEISGKSIPAACIIRVPSGTLVLSQSLSQGVAKLPNGDIVTIPIPSYGFYGSSLSGSASYASSGMTPATTAAPAASGPPPPPPSILDEAVLTSGPQLGQLQANYRAPNLPNQWNCGSCSAPPQVVADSMIGNYQTGNNAGGEIRTIATCRGSLCTFTWNMIAFYTYNNVWWTSSGVTANPGDTMTNDPYLATGGSNPLVCGDAWDISVEQSVCGYMNNPNFITLGLHFYLYIPVGASNACAAYPTSYTNYYSIYAYEPSGSQISIWFSNTGGTGQCGPYSSSLGRWLCDLEVTTTGYTASVDFEYSPNNPGGCVPPPS
jgi:hypothetical protein